MEPQLINKLSNGGTEWTVQNKIDVLTQGYVPPVTEKPIIIVTNTPNHVKKHVKRTSLFEFIAKKIDDIYDLYNDSTKCEIENNLRDTLIEFVTSKKCHKWLGPKKARIIVSFLMKNLYDEESLKITLNFLAWFLDDDSIKQINIDKKYNIVSE